MFGRFGQLRHCRTTGTDGGGWRLASARALHKFQLMEARHRYRYRYRSGYRLRYKYRYSYMYRCMRIPSALNVALLKPGAGSCGLLSINHGLFGSTVGCCFGFLGFSGMAIIWWYVTFNRVQLGGLENQSVSVAHTTSNRRDCFRDRSCLGTHIGKHWC